MNNKRIKICITLAVVDCVNIKTLDTVHLLTVR